VFVKFKVGDIVIGHFGTGVKALIIAVFPGQVFQKAGYTLKYTATGNIVQSGAEWVEAQYDFPHNGVTLFMDCL
jgi:hypothetical protein